jgi:hypothetical protein
MDKTSIVASHPALADGGPRLPGKRAFGRIRSTQSLNPTKVVSLERLTSHLKKRDPRDSRRNRRARPTTT